MHVFSRSVRLAQGDPGKHLDWALRITEKVNQISDSRIRLFRVVMSGEVGTLGWGMSVPTLAALEGLDDKLMADGGYLDLVAEAAQHITAAGVSDSLVRLLYAEPSINPDRTQYIQTAIATVAPGETERAVEVGIEIAQRSSALSGCSSTFGVHELGVVGTVQWSTYCESIEQYEQGMEAVNADAGFRDLTQRQTAGLFQGEARTTLVRRIA